MAKGYDYVIVGGGSAGWMSAAALTRAVGAACEIVLIESEQIGTVGVGEATIPSMVRYLRQLGIDEKAFMRACSATYKLGIAFDNWRETQHSYFHPFGLCGGRIDGIDLHPCPAAASASLRRRGEIEVRVGGMVGFVLEIEQEGVGYRTDANGRKVLPLFTTTPFTDEERREIQDRFQGYEFEWDNVPVFGVK